MKWFLVALFGVFITLTSAQAEVASLVADTRSGFILSATNATEQKPPASLTKLMTLYLTFSALDKGLIKMDDPLPISEHAAAQPKSKIGLIAGETMTVREAILALIIKSANDVAVVVAESLGRDEGDFAETMTRTAQALGMRDTVFKNASGLHADGQMTTAKDMAILTMALIEHYPQYYDLFATPSFTYHGQTYHSHNIVLEQYEGAEGLKTGYVSAVGYNIISTARQEGTRLVSIVLGEQSQLKRDLRAMRLLDKGFNQVKIQKRAEAAGTLRAPFNPLNRKAFLIATPDQVYLPRLKAGLLFSHKKVQTAARAHRPSTPVVVLPDDNTIEQGDSWSIQVGAFEGQDKARQIAEKALTVLGSSDKVIATPRANARFFRSRIQGFNRTEAHAACRRLKDASWQCLPIAPRG